ncbi:MAG: TolC family protein [Gemmatimonadota bacterium]|jgi:outer membrane protein TolC
MNAMRRVRLPWTAALLALVIAAPGAALAQQSGPETGPYRLTLGDAARLAARRSASVLQARSRVDQADARVRQSTSDLLPSVDASVVRGARTFNTASFGLDFSIPGQPPLFDPGGEVVGPVRSADVRASAEVPLLDLAALKRRKSAQAGVDAAREEAHATEERAAAMAAGAYLTALRSHAEVDARQQDLDLARELLGVARSQVEAGVGVELDVTRAEAQVATVRAQLLAARHKADVADLALRRALHLPAGAAVELADDLESRPVGEAPTEAEAVTRALDARGDLSTAEAYRDAAAQTLSAARAGRLPRISAGIDEGYYGKRFGHMLNTYSWNLRVSMPLFEGFRRSGEIEESRARIREMDYRIEDLEDQVAFQVRRALLNLSSAHEQADAADERLRLANLEVQQEEERIRAGVAGTADVVRAAMRLNDARTARLDALVALHASRVALAAAMGAVTELP